MNIDEEALRRIVKESVADAFKSVGLDARDPIELQKDFAYLRTWREMVQQGRTKAVMVVIKFLVLGFVASAMIGLGLPAKVIALFGLS